MIVPCAALWPKRDPLDFLLHWWGIAEALGAPRTRTRPFLIGIRGAKECDAETHKPVHRPAYDDTFVFIPPAEVGPTVVFPGATHAYQRDSKLSPDVDGDKRGDVGSIRCGRYELKDMGSQPYPIFLLTNTDGTGQIPAHRDTDHDGVISEAEAQRSETATKGAQVNKTGHYATAVLFHTGFDAPADAKHRSSIACQTASLKWLQLMRERAKPTGGVIDYVLVNAWDLVPIADEARRKRMGEEKIA